jgi:small subunit ribosomal protein S9e
MVRLGLLKDSERKLDYVLGLTIHQFFERRLQTIVAKKGIIGSKTSIHNARILCRQKHIAVGKQLVTIPSFMVRTSSEPHIQLSQTSVFKTGKLGRTKKVKQRGKGGDAE